jgi:hypothetical protein
MVALHESAKSLLDEIAALAARSASREDLRRI